MPAIRISPPEELTDFVEAQSRKEGFEGVDEYVHSIIRDARRREALKAVSSKIEEAPAGGPASPMTARGWDDIRREARRRHDERERTDDASTSHARP